MQHIAAKREALSSVDGLQLQRCFVLQNADNVAVDVWVQAHAILWSLH